MKSETSIVMFAILSSLAVRVFLFPIQGCSSDLATFEAWFKAAAINGPFAFYRVVSWCDYPPLNVYLFWTFGSAAKSLSLFGTPAVNFVLKLPSTLFDTATAGLIFLFLRKRVSFDASLIATSAYAFNPAIIFNGSIWGQFDAIYTFFLVLSLILALESKFTFSALSFTAAVLTKPQSIALAPLIVFLLLRNRNWKTIAVSALATIGLTLAVTFPLSPGNLGDFLVYIYLKGYRGYPYTSLNAFNIWGFGGFWKSDAQGLLFLDFFKIGWIMFGALVAFSLYYLFRMSRNLPKNDRRLEIPVFFTAFILLFGFFMLPTRIHERYLFPVFSVLALMLPFAKQTKLLFGILTFTHLANLAYVLPFLNSGTFISDGDPFVFLISAVSLAAFVFSLIIMIRNLKSVAIPVNQQSSQDSVGLDRGNREK